MSSVPQQDADLDLVRRCRGGDADASRALFDKYNERVFRIAYRYLNNHEDALDAAQQAFINAFASLAGFDGRSSFYTWLARIAVNAAIDLRRRRRRDPEMTQEAEILELGRLPERASQPSPEQQLEQREIEAAYRKAVDALPEPQRSVFVLHAFEQMSYKDIADTLHCSIGTVMSRLFYARKRLQKLLKPYL